jgi:hypothetical protein
MGIKATFTRSDMRKDLLRRVLVIDQQIISYLHRLGELCLIECRTNKTYMDQTGNLTASMGYIVVAHGKVINNGGFDAKYGGAVGHAFALKKAINFPSGYAMIMVAGMDYAYTVETRGYNVLASAEILAERQLPKMMAQLRKNIGKMK